MELKQVKRNDPTLTDVQIRNVKHARKKMNNLYDGYNALCDLQCYTKNDKIIVTINNIIPDFKKELEDWEDYCLNLIGFYGYAGELKD